jgi:hypothetical protein
MSAFGSPTGSHAGSQYGYLIHGGHHNLRQLGTYVLAASPLPRAAMSPAPGSYGPLQASSPSSASVGSRRHKLIKMFSSGPYRATWLTVIMSNRARWQCKSGELEKLVPIRNKRGDDRVRFLMDSIWQHQRTFVYLHTLIARFSVSH